MEDNSILTRIYNVIFGFYIISEYPLGLGFNYTGEKLNEIIISHQFLKQHYGLGNILGVNFGFTSSLALLISYYGICFLGFLVYIIYRFRPPILCLIFSMLFLTFSFSGAYPMIWILMALGAVIRKNRNGRKGGLHSSPVS